MQHPLDGARLKIVRAEEHLNALKDEIARYMDGKPYSFPIEQDEDSVKIHKAVITTEPPLRLSCLLGDCLVNLRSSLDYVAWQLAVRYAGRQLSPGTDRIYFPIMGQADNRHRFDKNRRPQLEKAYSIPAPAVDLIEGVQPYYAGYEPLGILNALVNADKHRLPLFTVASARTYRLGMDFPGRQKVWANAGVWLSMNLKAVHPSEPPLDPATMKMDCDFAIFVTLQDFATPREPIDVAMENIFKCVANVVPRFDALV